MKYLKDRTNKLLVWASLCLLQEVTSYQGFLRKCLQVFKKPLLAYRDSLSGLVLLGLTSSDQTLRPFLFPKDFSCPLTA